jgi:hypothetical protein
MLRKIAHLSMAATFVAGIGAISVQPAEAGRGGNFAAGVAAGVIGLGLLGAYAHARDRYYAGGCYRGPSRCEWRPGRCYYNDYGERICRRGYEHCYRPTYCD